MLAPSQGLVFPETAAVYRYEMQRDHRYRYDNPAQSMVWDAKQQRLTRGYFGRTTSYPSEIPPLIPNRRSLGQFW